MAKKVKQQKTIEVAGKKLSLFERDALMKLDYVNTGMTIEELSIKYDLADRTIKDIRARDNWVADKKAYMDRLTQECQDNIFKNYVQNAELINMNYNAAWQKVYNLCATMLSDPSKYLLNKEGGVRAGMLSVLSDLLTKAQQGQAFTSGLMSKEEAMKLQIQREQLELKKQQLGESDGTIVEDGFIDMLEGLGKDLSTGEVLHTND